MVVQAPSPAQKPSQQSSQAAPWEQLAGQDEPVPVQVRPQFPDVLQLLPQQTRPSTQVESSLHGQPKPAQPPAAAGCGATRALRPATAVAASAVSARSTERREPERTPRVQRSKSFGSTAASHSPVGQVSVHHHIAQILVVQTADRWGSEVTVWCEGPGHLASHPQQN